jgi:hypothetical protein
MIGAGVFIIVVLAWLLSRWWYLKFTNDGPSGRTVLWLYAGQVTLFTSQASGTRVRRPPAPPTPQTSMEFLPVAKLQAAPTWHWNFQWETRLTGLSSERTIAIPLWAVVAATGLFVYLPSPARFFRGRGCCPACGYDLSGITLAVCPECGSKLPGRVTSSSGAR